MPFWIPYFRWLRGRSEGKQFAVFGSAPSGLWHRMLSRAAGVLPTYLTLLNARKTTRSGHCFANFIVRTLRCVSLTRHSEACYWRSAAENTRGSANTRRGRPGSVQRTCTEGRAAAPPGGSSTAGAGESQVGC